MDKIEKAAFGTIIAGAIALLALIGVGCWAFIELVLWVTSK